MSTHEPRNRSLVTEAERETAARRAAARARQLAGLPPMPPSIPRPCALAIRPHDRGPLTRPKVNIATGRVLIDISAAPSMMEEHYQRHHLNKV